MNKQLGIGAALAVAAATLMGSAALAEETLVINSFGGSYEKTHRDLVITPFEEEYGVKVKVITAYSSDTLAQLRAQKDNPQFDVVHFSGGLETTAAAEGLLAPIKPEELTHYDEMYPFAVAGLDKGVGPMYSTAVIGLLYNTEAVPEAPTSWKDLADPAYADHVLLTDAAGNTYGMLGMLMINKVAGGTLDDITPGLDFIKSILPTSTIVAKSPEIQQNFAQGNAWIAPYAQDYAYTLTKAGLPVKFTLPKEGGVIAPITVNLVAGRPNRELALKFIDFSIRAEASRGWAEALRYSPTNRTVELPDDVAAEVTVGEEAAAKLVTFDAETISKNKPEWNEAWTRAIAR
ncbi:ABC transporter substrate-binding protein [Rhodobium gokarnense]|uniref:Spermidine/putrescine transport system substrate-binding protein n=1 Tax=Rhodobium gokarnense TaxID=364296 RepID=A0ABT3H6E4_9HYPH|nr:ABC transporter substrate-binding protein [Rhodobium gokarnense]MCW2305955.1 putative spermidine/putrescine transport system substrate-binding protein [Rhodobium gokarnense]